MAILCISASHYFCSCIMLYPNQVFGEMVRIGCNSFEEAIKMMQFTITIMHASAYANKEEINKGACHRVHAELTD